MSPVETLTVVGLLFDATGALVLVLPELPLFDPVTRPQEKINRIDEGRDILFTKGELTPGDTCFSEIGEILADHLELHGPLKEIVATDPGSLSSGDEVEPRYETDGDAVYAQPPTSPSSTLVDRWCERAVRRLERNAELPFFQWGVRLLLVGFILQLVAAGIQL